MTRQKIEEAINNKYGTTEKQLKLLKEIAKLHLLVMESGVPKKKEILQYKGSEIDLVTTALIGQSQGYNQAIDDFTAYLAQKLSGLEEVIYKNSEDNGGCGVVISPEQLLTAIRKYLEVER